jgi:hypothetical protein
MKKEWHSRIWTTIAARAGVALGRVLAHEIGHVLINAPEHDSTRLMRATFSPINS